MASLYAIVGDLARARLMLAAKVPYLQLRFKGRPLWPHRAEVSDWRDEYPETRLVINDDLEFAHSVEAWGVHLGQEDLMRYATADLQPQQSVEHQSVEQRPRLGISTHDEGEIARALELGADAIGFGPVYPTQTKAILHVPQGLELLAEVVARVPLPVVAIGGINADNAAPVVATGVARVAMVSGLDQYCSPEQIKALMAELEKPRLPH